MDDFPPFKNYVVVCFSDGDYMIYCSSDTDRAFDFEDKHMASSESIYMFGAEDLVSIIKMYGHHIGEVDV